jgi:LemA protein
MKLLRNLVLLLLAFSLTGCGYNAIQKQDEAVKAAWSEVLNQYQRRADLVPNLVNTVKGYAQHEEKVFVEVTNARAKVGSLQINADSLNDPQKLQQFQAAQGQLGSALSRLMVVSENYPQLKADGLFQNLQAQLEGTENRVTVARNKVKPNFSVENEKAISTAPTVDFGNAAPATPTPAAASSAH